MDKISLMNEAVSTCHKDQYVTFTLDDEEYGVEVLKVQEIIGYQGFTRVPSVPSFVKGVINLRGLVVPIVDLRIKLSMQEKAYDNFTVILILEVRGKTIGAIVDAVSDVVNLKEDEVQATPDFASGVSVDFIAGMGRRGDKLIIMLDIDKVLNIGDLVIADAA